VTLTVRVIEDASSTGAYVKVVGVEDKGRKYYFTSAELGTGILAPRPIQVGDRVTWGSGWGSGRVNYELIAIRGEEACLGDPRIYGVLQGSGGLSVTSVSSLVKVSP